MLSWALKFFFAAVLAAAIALSGLGATVALILKIVVAILLALSTISLIAGLRRPR
ncbi:MAG TPA: hypothetical protein VIV54_14600 [Burkholderiales bacterium]